ncbi:copper resistance protein NlpE N-terminal domain-containing protein [Pokkaliibacter sp. CJK22405]|uniref:copper resistance protein NlpE N-terminal domain-containing protein n=1 Tax=Pokkaliibacter sp. CJK22405 TaxID=3384615 RepID=UPI003984733B
MPAETRASLRQLFRNRALRTSALLLPLALASCASTSNPSAPNTDLPSPPEATDTSEPAPQPAKPAAPVTKAGTPWQMPANFSGTLPCADCEGIEVNLSLLASHSYVKKTTYLGLTPVVKTEIGSWQFDHYRLHLSSAGDHTAYAMSSDHSIEMLDKDGNPIESALNYRLLLNDSNSGSPIVPMQGVFSYRNDVAIFKECSSGRTWPVSATQSSLNLQKALLGSDNTPHTNALVDIDAHLAVTSKNKERVEVDHLKKLQLDQDCP